MVCTAMTYYILRLSQSGTRIVEFFSLAYLLTSRKVIHFDAKIGLKTIISSFFKIWPDIEPDIIRCGDYLLLFIFQLQFTFSIILHYFQVYSVVVRQSYTLQVAQEQL